MSKHDENLLQHLLQKCGERIEQLEQAMTYTASAYVQRWDGKFHVFLHTPSGAVVRLWTTYNNAHTAEEAVITLGFRLVPVPTKRPTVTLNRGNTAPR